MIIKLNGGFGNQMFQYVLVRSLQAAEELACLDHDFFKLGDSTDTFTSRKYELGIFKNLKARKATRDEIKFFT